MPPKDTIKTDESVSLKSLYDFFIDDSDRGLSPFLRAFNKAFTYPISGLGDPLLELDMINVQARNNDRSGIGRDNTRELTAYYLDLIDKPDYLIPTEERPMDAPKYESIEEWYKIADEDMQFLIDGGKTTGKLGGRNDERPYSYYQEISKPQKARGRGDEIQPSPGELALGLEKGEALKAWNNLYTGVDLGRYTKSYGRDEEGRLYASLFDVWDFDPDQYDYGWDPDEPRPESGIFKNITDPTYVQPWLMDQVGKPFAVYNRIYLDEDRLSDVVDSVNYVEDLGKLMDNPDITAKEIFEFQEKNNKWQTTE